jgi:site-specific recombinase XerD
MKNEIRFHQLIRSFLTDYLVVRRSFSDKTVRSYRQTLNILRRYCRDEKGIPFDKMNFACLSKSIVYDFLVWLRDTHQNASGTLNLRLSAIKSFLKYCGEESMDLMPMYLEVAGIHAFKECINPRIDYLTPSQLKLLFETPDVKTRLGRRNRFFLIFAYETGARLQELLDLTLGGIIRSDSSIRVRLFGKGAKVRYVPLLRSTVAHLNAYLSEFHASGNPDDSLFYTIHGNAHTTMKPGTVDHFLKKYARVAKESAHDFPIGLHAHMLRHSIAMAMYKKGIPISYIRDFLGHKSVDTTSRYSYADEDTITHALESVGNDLADDRLPNKKRWKGKEDDLLEYCGLL